MAAIKASLTTKVPSPKLQGGHSSSAAVTQKTKIQPKSGPKGTGTSDIKYSNQPSGTKGTSVPKHAK